MMSAGRDVQRKKEGINNYINRWPNRYEDNVLCVYLISLMIMCFYFYKYRFSPLNHVKRLIRSSLQKTMNQCLYLILKSKLGDDMTLTRVKRRSTWRVLPARQQNKLQGCKIVSSMIFKIPQKLLSKMICWIFVSNS